MMAWSTAKRRRAKGKRTNVKRNKKKVRRLRHAKRLSKIISDARAKAHRFRPHDDYVLHGSAIYGVGTVDHLRQATRFGQSFMSAGVNLSGVNRWSNTCSAIDCVPMVLQATIRGRRMDQVHAEIRENRSRIRHGDIT